MRRIFTLIGCCITVVGFSQLQVGTRLLSGQLDLGLNSMVQEGAVYYKTEGFSSGIQLGLQKLYKPNRIRGFDIGFNYSDWQNTRTSGTVTGRETQKTLRRGLSARYFEQMLLPLGVKWYGTATVAGRLGYAFEQEKGYANNFKYDNYQLSVGITPGVAYHFHQRWLADIQLGQLGALTVNHRKGRTGQAGTIRDSQTNVNLSSLFSGLTTFSIGFRYILR